MISGIAIAAKSLKPSISIFAAEPTGADDAYRSKQEGRLLHNDTTDTMADGLRASMGPLTWCKYYLVVYVTLWSSGWLCLSSALCFVRIVFHTSGGPAINETILLDFPYA